MGLIRILSASAQSIFSSSYLKVAAGTARLVSRSEGLEHGGEVGKTPTNQRRANLTPFPLRAHVVDAMVRVAVKLPARRVLVQRAEALEKLKLWYMVASVLPMLRY